MRHSNISLTMGTYTDARLLDTSEAVESLRLLSEKPNASDEKATEETQYETIETTPRTLAPMLAPNSDNGGQNGSISDNSVGRVEVPLVDEKSRKTLGFSAFSQWALRDSNPRPSRCKRDALTN
jgi:hypothetical protein